MARYKGEKLFGAWKLPGGETVRVTGKAIYEFREGYEHRQKLTVSTPKQVADSLDRQLERLVNWEDW